MVSPAPSGASVAPDLPDFLSPHGAGCLDPPWAGPVDPGRRHPRAVRVRRRLRGQERKRDSLGKSDHYRIEVSPGDAGVVQTVGRRICAESSADLEISAGRRCPGAGPGAHFERSSEGALGRIVVPDFLKSPFVDSRNVAPLDVLVRLLAALALGGLVAWIYCRTRKRNEVAASFPTTLVLLSVLIAMVTQVIGDNVARAFSLVGALSIVRFRTVVRDTQDTAYVIFAVVVGMAVGANNIWVSLIGIVVVGLAAFVMMTRPGLIASSQPAFLLSLRVGLGFDLDKLLGGTLDAHLEERELLSISTARQGISLDVTYETRLRRDRSADELVKALNRVEGVQSVQLQRRGFDPLT